MFADPFAARHVSIERSLLRSKCQLYRRFLTLDRDHAAEL